MKPGSRTSSWGYRIALAILVVTNLAAAMWIARPLLEARGVRLPFLPHTQKLPGEASATPEPSASLTLEPTRTEVPILLQNSTSPEENLHAQGVLVVSMRDGHFSHLFAYHPLYLPLTRLTNHPWDDRSPSISPDGSKLAYQSRENGYWDLFVLDLTSGEKTRLTDTPEYEGSPTWSPDGEWIAYERYNGVSLDIYIQSLSEISEPIQLTNDPAIDTSPAWSPAGREIAFVSTRSGDEEIWLARLDNTDNRFVNLSSSPLTRDRSPVWSPDGSRLAWAGDENGDRRLVVWTSGQNPQITKRTGEGDRPAWSPDSSLLFSQIDAPNQTGLAAYSAGSGRLAIPFTPLSGKVYGFTWVKGPLPAWLDEQIHHPDGTVSPALWEPAYTRTVSPSGRAALVPLDDVTAPQALLQDGIDEAFTALRAQVAFETGWDTLSSLENAYIPLTSPPTPSIQDDWLYTGRAFAANPLLLSANWMAITREDFHGQTYWRIYLKARYQDGSMGEPLTAMIWDLNARYGGDPRAYEQGGKLGEVPAGFWIDFTEIASRYGWERLASSINWRTFYPSIRFNQYVITGGLEWRQAMEELYPVEALNTATPLPTYTPTPTETPRFTPRPVTATVTPSITPVPSLRPTWTPPPTEP